jgi:copper chaperone CopZ
MKKLFAIAALASSTLAAHAEYEQVNLTVFGMDCAPCAHAIRVSMKGIPGVENVDVDLNTGLVSVRLALGNTAAIRQFNQAVEKNGFTHKDATIVVRGKLGGSAAAPFLDVVGAGDRYALVPDTTGVDMAQLVGKTVTVAGVLPQAAKGKVADTLRYRTIQEAQ